MLRIRVSTNPPGRPHADAPILSADLELADHIYPIAFLIDTGADHTVVDALTARMQADVMSKGIREKIKGVGGKWPVRRFRDVATILTLARDESEKEVPIRISLPTLDVMAPFAQFKGDDVLEILHPVAPSDRRLSGHSPRIRRVENVVPLLGRDVFKASRMKLDWDPNGDSWLYL